VPQTPKAPAVHAYKIFAAGKLYPYSGGIWGLELKPLLKKGFESKHAGSYECIITHAQSRSCWFCQPVKTRAISSPKMQHKGRLERQLVVLPNLPTHSSQSKTYGNPFLPPGSPVLQVQMRSSQDHRFFCKEKHHRLTVCA